jgi:hypothetical protein
MSVFNGKSPHLPTALAMAGEDLWYLSTTGARGLSLLTGCAQEA